MSAGSSLRHKSGLLALLVAAAAPAVALGNPRAVVVQPGNARYAASAPPEAARPQPTTERGQLAVTVDRAKVIRLPESTKMVVVGNPSIADIAVQKNGIVVVTGKSYGVTNLIALDASGNMLAESTLSVAAPSDAIVTVQRGLERQSYSCNPSCLPSVVLGDANSYFNENKAQADQHTQFASPH